MAGMEKLVQFSVKSLGAIDEDMAALPKEPVGFTPRAVGGGAKERGRKESMRPWTIQARPDSKVERKKRLGSTFKELPRLNVRKSSMMAVEALDEILKDDNIIERKDLNKVTLKRFPSIELFQSDESQLSARGIQHRTPEQFKKAMTTATSLARMSKDGTASSHRHFRAYFTRGYARQRLENWEGAVQDYTEALKIRPENSASFFNRAGCLWQMGLLSEALNDMDFSIKNEPSNKIFYEFRAALLRKLGRYDEATKDYFSLRRLALGLNPIDSTNPDDTAQLVLPESERGFDCYEILRKEPVSRTMEDLQRLQKAFKRIAFFDNLSVETIRAICKAITLSIHEKKTYVFHEGDKAEALYIVLKGTVSVVKEIIDKSNEDEPKTKLILLKLLYAGDSFGNVGLQQTNRKRTASVMTDYGCELLMLDFDSYHSALGRHEDRIIRQRVESLQKVRIFKTWTYSKLLRLSNAIIVKTFEPHCVLLRQNQMIPALFLIHQGVCKVTKSVPADYLAQNIARPESAGNLKTVAGRGRRVKGGSPMILEGESSSSVKDLESWVLDSGWRKSTINEGQALDEMEMTDRGANTEMVEFVIGVLAPGQVFGELAVLDPNEKSPVTVTCETATEVFEIRKEIIDELELRFNKETMTGLQQSLKFHSPCGAKISYFYDEKRKWDKEKSKILSTMIVPKHDDRPKTSFS